MFELRGASVFFLSMHAMHFVLYGFFYSVLLLHLCETLPDFSL